MYVHRLRYNTRGSDGRSIPTARQASASGSARTWRLCCRSVPSVLSPSASSSSDGAGAAPAARLHCAETLTPQPAVARFCGFTGCKRSHLRLAGGIGAFWRSTRVDVELEAEEGGGRRTKSLPAVVDRLRNFVSRKLSFVFGHHSDQLKPGNQVAKTARLLQEEVSEIDALRASGICGGASRNGGLLSPLGSVVRSASQVEPVRADSMR